MMRKSDATVSKECLPVDFICMHIKPISFGIYYSVALSLVPSVSRPFSRSLSARFDQLLCDSRANNSMQWCRPYRRPWLHFFRCLRACNFCSQIKSLNGQKVNKHNDVTLSYKSFYHTLCKLCMVTSSFICFVVPVVSCELEASKVLNYP